MRVECYSEVDVDEMSVDLARRVAKPVFKLIASGEYDDHSFILQSRPHRHSQQVFPWQKALPEEVMQVLEKKITSIFMRYFEHVTHYLISGRIRHKGLLDLRIRTDMDGEKYFVINYTGERDDVPQSYSPSLSAM